MPISNPVHEIASAIATVRNHLAYLVLITADPNNTRKGSLG
ncbi:hypothetical protein GCM10010522_68630 [Kribbella solani]